MRAGVCAQGRATGRISINLLHYCSHFHSLHHQSMCSVRFKIFKSVICQHYEVNTRPQDWCPICHYAFHLAWPHIHHKNLTWPFVVPTGKDFNGVCSSTAEQTCYRTLEKNYRKCVQMRDKKKKGEKNKLQHCEVQRSL